MSKAGSLTVVLMHCLISDDGQSMDHFMHALPDDVITDAPNVYSLSLTRPLRGAKQVVGGFFVKTSLTDKSADFHGVMMGMLAQIPALAVRQVEGSTLATAKVAVPYEMPTEQDMLQVMLTQFVKYSTVGRA